MTATITEKPALTAKQQAQQDQYRSKIRNLVASGAIRIEDAPR